MVYNGTYGEKDKRFGDRLGDMVPCFPLDTLLAAMDRRHVDYLSLDVEGYELDILRSISWDKFIIDVISVEYVMLKEGKKALKDYMETIGYVTFDDINYSDGKHFIWVNDYIFVRADLFREAGLKSKL